MANGTIFINYRRDDSRGDAGRFYDRLHVLYPDRVFRDVGSLEPGVQWHEAIEQVLGKADACIVVIGKRWLSVTDAAGQRRLDNPRDTVRHEILTALNNGMAIFPVLVGDADMPPEEQVPVDLRPLMQRNAIELTEQNWDEDFNRLVAAIERSLGWSPELRANPRPTGSTTSSGHDAPAITARPADAPPPERAISTRRVLVALAVLLVVAGLGFAAVRGGHLRWAADAEQRPRAEVAGPIHESSPPVTRAARQPVPAPVPRSLGVEPPSAEQQGAQAESSGRGSTPPAPRRSDAVCRSREASVAVRSPQSAPLTERPPRNPAVYLQCAGARDVCAALRTAFDQALEKESLPSVRGPGRAEILIAANVAVVDERVDQQFGTTFTIRTYSIDVTGEASRWDESIPMPAPRTLSFDSTFGRDRLVENAHVIAESAVEKVQASWRKRVP